MRFLATSRILGNCWFFFSILKIIFYFFATFISFRKEGHLPLSWFILSEDLRGRVFSLNAYPRGKWYHVACRSWSQTLSISLKVDYSHMRHTPIYSVEFVFNLKNRIFLGNKVIVSGIKTTKKSTLSSNQWRKNSYISETFQQLFGIFGEKNNNFLATLDIFIGNFLRIYRQLVVKPKTTCVT